MTITSIETIDDQKKKKKIDIKELEEENEFYLMILNALSLPA